MPNRDGNLYDIFISYKDTNPENGLKTMDSRVANSLYDDLEKEGLIVFKCDKEREKRGNTTFSEAIDEAVEEVYCKILIATKSDYILTPWIKDHEWVPFLKRKNRNINLQLILMFGDDINETDLQEIDRQVQAEQSVQIDKLAETNIYPILDPVSTSSDVKSAFGSAADTVVKLALNIVTNARRHSRPYIGIDPKPEPVLKNNEKLDNQNALSFGRYPQGENGEVEPLEWQVLASEASKKLLITKYGIEYRPYNEVDKSNIGGNTWKSSDLRKWANFDFWSEAFNNDERKRIIPSSGIIDGDVKDKVFCLSIEEAEKYFASDKDRRVSPTPFAVKNASDAYVENGFAFWWLRSPGERDNLAACVNADGCISDGQFQPRKVTEKSSVTVRLACWIKS